MTQRASIAGEQATSVAAAIASSLEGGIPAGMQKLSDTIARAAAEAVTPAPNALIPAPAPRRFASFISEYFRDSSTPSDPARSAASTASFVPVRRRWRRRPRRPHSDDAARQHRGRTGDVGGGRDRIQPGGRDPCRHAEVERYDRPGGGGGCYASPNALMPAPAPRRFASFISEYLRDSSTPSDPARNAASTASLRAVRRDLL